ncbi:aspartate dehydrogenase domain-containing protein [Corynebacterium sp. HMSC05D03]|uniref:aspartate dehydrogenase domain-containing protein n=1 Tax=Corynebacterium sp. HMSC05D03 TaxID=1581115 RepID=UPI0008A35ECB|nr:aspartate dehydrogenase domain-containing protein [Corynebacterium sp. HMSC05D03]OFT67091.1 aspartate dehydrogenase [Corynebacterium sp. HMSC05D03]
MSASAPRVLLLGFGAIGRQLVSLFDPSEFEVSAFVRDAAPHRERGTLGVSLYDDNLPKLIDAHDIVVECAGVAAAKEHGPAVITRGKDLVLTSVGALADPDARQTLLSGPGKVHVTSGAIGGFDLWAALAESNAVDTVKIRTTKKAEALIQGWMNDEERAQLENATEPFLLFSGRPSDAIAKFPGNVNVSVALAWATRGRGSSDDELLARSLERVSVELIASPNLADTHHHIEVTGSAGAFSLVSESAPSPVNPKTSAITALSVAHTLRHAMAPLQ